MLRRAGAAIAVAAATLLAAPGPAGSTGSVSSNDPYGPKQWNLAIIGADQAWSVATQPVTIAIVDSGVHLRHEDLADRLVPGRDFIDGDDDPSDQHGHGTHVAGIAAAATGNGRGVASVAPQARIMPIRVLDEKGEGNSKTVAEGVRWAVDHGADVVNLSLGAAAASVLGTGLDDAVAYAWDHGAIAVVAAGNDYVLSSGFGDEPAVVVAATTEHDTEPDYSNGVGAARWGISAPGGGGSVFQGGKGVVSTYWTGPDTNIYAEASGTSMAAPHVSGALAVLLGAGLTPKEAVDRLMATAVDLGRPGYDDVYGAGRLDLAAATAGMAGAGAPSPAPPPPEPSASPPPAEPAPAVRATSPRRATSAATATTVPAGPPPEAAVDEPTPSTVAVIDAPTGLETETAVAASGEPVAGGARAWLAGGLGLASVLAVRQMRQRRSPRD